jgi:light-regulated signal transduction histidine kinase (bacteriophytochrome)
VIALAFLIGDIVLPRGATVAIGYCLVPVVAAGTWKRGFVIAMTIACSVLTWVGYFTEPAGAPAWMSVFDRVMVTGVLWLAMGLALRRAVLIAALTGQTRALESTQRQLEGSNDELRSFACMVAHDIRGPLNTIRLLAELIRGNERIKSDGECSESIGSVVAEVTRMNDLIASLLSFSAVGSGTITLGACDCEEVFSGATQSLRAEIQGSGATVTHDPLPTVRGDPCLISDLFQNLIQNAIKYRGQAAPRIHVSAAEGMDGWVFSVRDNGIGVRPEDAARIFEPFHQVRRSGGAGGVGLGLATCKRIVERHNGRIEVRRNAEGGSTFQFTIPRQPIGIDRPPPVEGERTPRSAAQVN